MPSPASAFTIQEVAGEKRALVLRGRALPYRPLTLSGSMRASVTYYAGNPVGSLQVLGAQEEVASIQGFWKDRFIGDSSDAEYLGVPVQSVRELARVADDYRRRGQMIEVRWDDQVRVGVMTKLELKWHTPHDAEWAMDFAWVSQGEAATATTVAEVDQQNVAEDLANNAAAVVTAYQTQPTSLKEEINNACAAASAAILDAAAQAMEVVALTTSAVTAPVDAASRMLGVLQLAEEQATEVMLLTDASAQQVRSKYEATPTLAQDLLSVLYLRNLRAAARTCRSGALYSREGLRSSSTLASAPTSHTLRLNEDLRAVATRYFGTPDEWRRIALFNGMDGATAPVGTVLAIPPSRSASRPGGL